MASSPITSWQILIEGEKVEAVIDILFLAPESLWTETAATAAMKLKDTCSLKGKLWHRLHIQKQRHYFANKVCLVKAMVFPVVVYGCENWSIKKAECQRIDAFELWCWRRLSRVPWTTRRSRQSILKEISSEYSLEGLISFRIDCLDLLVVQGTLKSLLQYHSLKASILQHSALFMIWLSFIYVYMYTYTYTHF